MPKANPAGIVLPRGAYYAHRPAKPLHPHLFRVSDPHSGKMVNKSFANPKAGRKWAEAMLGGMRARTVAVGRVGWADAGAEYVAAITASGRRAKYVASVQRIVAAVADRGARDITAPRFRTIVQSYVETVTAAEGARQPGAAMSPASRATFLAIIRAICRHACHQHRIPFDPVGGIKAPKVPRVIIETLTVDELRACLAPHLEADPYFLRFALLVYLGLRERGEGLSLRWQDWDVGRRVMKVAMDAGGELKSGEREVPVPDELADLLRRTPKASDCILPDVVRLDHKRGPVGDKTDYQRFKVYLTKALTPEGAAPVTVAKVKARVAKIKRHSLRHAFARLMAATGVGLPTLHGWLGHTSISTTMIYAKGAEHYEEQVQGWPKGQFRLRIGESEAPAASVGAL